MNTLKIVQSLTAPHNTNVLWLNSANNLDNTISVEPSYPIFG